MQLAQEHRTRTNDKVLFLDTIQAAAYLGLKKTTLEAWRCRGGGPSYKKLGRSVRYKLSDLDAWIESRTRSNTSEKGEI